MKESIINAIIGSRIVAIVRGIKKDDIVNVATAIYEGGVTVMEITFDQSGRITDEQTGDMIKQVSEKFEGKMIIGAGTVLTLKQAEIASSSKAKFFVSPDTNVEIIEFAKRNGIVSMPGAMTPTECVTAYNAGADFVKIFPSNSLGLGYIKAVRAPLSHIPFIAVGGVSTENIKDFFAAGLSGVGIGSDLVSSELVKQGRFEKITENARKYVSALND